MEPVARPPSLQEEIANSITHGLGLLLSLVGFGALLALAATRGEVGHVVGVSVFGASMVFVYGASTLYHSFQQRTLKRILQIVDHVAIYFMIAGTYTPFLLAFFDGHLRWSMLAAVWTLALAGSFFKIFFIGRYRLLSTLMYVAMGWLIVVALGPFLEVTPLGCVGWIVAGGICYTIGVVFFLWERLPFNHAVWHLFVLGGSICHYIAVTRYVLPW